MVRTKTPHLSTPSESSEPYQPSDSPSSPPSKKRKLSPKPKPKPKAKTKPKEKGVVIMEPVTTRAQSKKGSPSGKGKGTKAPSPPPSDSSNTPTFSTKPSKKPKYDEKLAKAMAGMLEQAILEGKDSKKSGTKKGQSSKKPEVQEEEITFPPKGFNVSKLEESQKYLSHFSRRKVCKTHCIDLQVLQEVLKYDLSPYLESYMPWLSVKLPFCTKVVSHFYCNLEILNDPVRRSVEEEMTTKVRGQNILISPSRINTWLGIEDPPDDHYPNLDPNQIFSVLRPGELVGPLNFNPSDMSDFHRVLWYIYSRALVNKANNYTHFTDRDYRKFASLLLKEQKDLGEYIFAEMQKYKLEGKRSTPMPYP